MNIRPVSTILLILCVSVCLVSCSPKEDVGCLPLEEHHAEYQEETETAAAQQLAQQNAAQAASQEVAAVEAQAANQQQQIATSEVQNAAQANQQANQSEAALATNQTANQNQSLQASQAANQQQQQIAAATNQQQQQQQQVAAAEAQNAQANQSEAALATNQNEPFLSQIFNNVYLYTQGDKAKINARQGMNVKNGQSVHTAVNSRAEVTFPDKTVARIGALTKITFNMEQGEWNLSNGSMLFSKHKDGKLMRITGGFATAAITGTTGFMTCKEGKFSEFGLLEGKAKVTYKGGRVFEIVPGKKLVLDSRGRLRLRSFDVEKMMKESPFFTDFTGKLPGDEAIQKEVDRLKKLKLEAAKKRESGESDNRESTPRRGPTTPGVPTVPYPYVPTMPRVPTPPPVPPHRFFND